MYESLLGILVLNIMNKTMILVRPKAVKESSSPFHLFVSFAVLGRFVIDSCWSYPQVLSKL